MQGTVYAPWVVRGSSVDTTVCTLEESRPIRPSIHVPITEVRSELLRARARSWPAAVRRSDVLGCDAGCYRVTADCV